jgi:hypothetical protein
MRPDRINTPATLIDWLALAFTVAALVALTHA